MGVVMLVCWVLWFGDFGLGLIVVDYLGLLKCLFWCCCGCVLWVIVGGLRVVG